MLGRHLSLLLFAASIAYAEDASAQATTTPDRAEGRPIRVAAVDPGFRTDAAPGADADTASPSREWVKGYQVESGVATSSISRGRPQYTGRYDASSQTTAAITVDRLGPGALALSVWNATAMARYAEQPGTAVQFDLSAGYTVRIGKAVEASLGYTLSLYPKAAPGTPVDGAHELYASLAYENRILTPKVAIYGEVVRQKGVYASLSGSRSFELGPVTLSPQISLGVAAYREMPMQINDATASLSAQWTFLGPAYLALRGAFSYLCGPEGAMPEDQRTPLGRSVPWAMLAVGAQK